MPTIAFSQSFPDLTDAKPKALRLGAASYETPVWSKVLEVPKVSYKPVKLREINKGVPDNWFCI